MMIDRDRTKYVYQILAGGLECCIADRTLKFQQPALEDIYRSEQIYDEMFLKARLLGVMSNDEAFNYLLDYKLWTLEQQEKLDAVPKRIDELKLILYNRYAAFKPTEKTRQELTHYKKQLGTLSEKRNVFSTYTAESLGAFARNQYIACMGYGIDFFNEDYTVLMKVSETFMQSMLSENIIRELARTEPWRIFWYTCKDGQNLFGVPAGRFTANQRALISWSKFFDSIHESADCPSNDVLEDEDLLDGWLLLQKEKRKNAEKQREADKYSKLGNDADIFVPVESQSDAVRVDSLNTAQARISKRQVLETVQKHGIVNEVDLPESQQKLRSKALQQRRDHFKKG